MLKRRTLLTTAAATPFLTEFAMTEEAAAADLRVAFRSLGRFDAVFGPAEDGGYWLVALGPRRPAQPFVNARWSTQHALADTLRNRDDIAAALHDYERRRIARTSGIVRQSRQAGWVGQWENGLACKARDLVAKYVLSRVQMGQIEQLVRYQV